MAEELGLPPREGARQALQFLERQALTRAVTLGPEQARQEALAIACARSELGLAGDADVEESGALRQARADAKIQAEFTGNLLPLVYGGGTPAFAQAFGDFDAAYGGFLRAMLDGPSEAALAPETAAALRAIPNTAMRPASKRPPVRSGRASPTPSASRCRSACLRRASATISSTTILT